MLHSVTPQRINVGLPAKITCIGYWPYSTSLLIRLNKSVIVEATYITENSLSFGMPMLTNYTDEITIELSVDFGVIWS